jgi:hypothetical protein
MYPVGSMQSKRQTLDMILSFYSNEVYSGNQLLMMEMKPVSEMLMHFVWFVHLFHDAVGISDCQMVG